MARFTREDLQAQYDRTVPDLIGPDLRLLFVGINPGLWTAAVQTHFARPGNRFYPALLAGGVIERPVDPSDGMDDDDRAAFVARGLGLTNLVRRATARADELSAAELREGAEQLVALVRERRPAVVAVAGITAYRTGFGRRGATTGPQTDLPEGWPDDVALWVVPNPSGLNAHDTVDTLAESYAAAARAAGVIA